MSFGDPKRDPDLENCPSATLCHPDDGAVIRVMSQLQGQQHLARAPRFKGLGFGVKGLGFRV